MFWGRLTPGRGRSPAAAGLRRRAAPILGDREAPGLDSHRRPDSQGAAISRRRFGRRYYAGMRCLTHARGDGGPASGTRQRLRENTAAHGPHRRPGSPTESAADEAPVLFCACRRACRRRSSAAGIHLPPRSWRGHRRHARPRPDRCEGWLTATASDKQRIEALTTRSRRAALDGLESSARGPVTPASSARPLRSPPSVRLAGHDHQNRTRNRSARNAKSDAGKLTTSLS